MFEKIEKLLDAGFTKDEIMKMLPKEPGPAKDPEPEKNEPEPKQKTEEPAKNEKQEKPEEKKPDPEPFDTQPFTKALDDMSASLNALNVKLQKMALSMYEQPEGKEKTVESIIARIVDPDA